MDKLVIKLPKLEELSKNDLEILNNFDKSYKIVDDEVGEFLRIAYYGNSIKNYKTVYKLSNYIRENSDIGKTHFLRIGNIEELILTPRKEIMTIDLKNPNLGEEIKNLTLSFNYAIEVIGTDIFKLHVINDDGQFSKEEFDSMSYE